MLEPLNRGEGIRAWRNIGRVVSTHHLKNNMNSALLSQIWLLQQPWVQHHLLTKCRCLCLCRTSYRFCHFTDCRIWGFARTWTIQESRLLYYLSREIKMWLNINHITEHNKTYCIFSNSKNSYWKYKSYIINKLVIYVIYKLVIHIIYTHTLVVWTCWCEFVLTFSPKLLHQLKVHSHHHLSAWFIIWYPLTIMCWWSLMSYSCSETHV